MAVLEKLRIEVIARNYLQKGVSIDEVFEKLMQDPHFQKKEQKLGREKVMQTLLNLREKTQTNTEGKVAEKGKSEFVKSLIKKGFSV